MSDDGGERLRISLRDLKPIEAALEALEEPAPLPPTPHSATHMRVTFAPPEPTAPSGDDDDLAEEATMAAAMPLGTRTSMGSDETVVGKGLAAQAESIVGGRYIIEESIGEGGMGRVFKARHRRLGKIFALKLMQNEFSEDPLARELFNREAKLASSLAHPNIVSIIDFGEDPSLGAFMVMELLEGESLSDRLHGDEPFSLRPAFDVILQVAEALDYIHKRGIVHCDIKPDNILLIQEPGKRRRHTVKLLDFGLARMGSATPKSSNVIDGTPEYMAPERIRGIAPQAPMDIYSVGVLAYEIFTGKVPFKGSVPEILQQHLHSAPPPFPDHLRQALDERAEGLVMKAMAKKPEERQKDMASFIYELRTLMDMLGFKRRRGQIALRERGSSNPRDKRQRAAAAGYDLSPLPMAGLNVDGQIVVANRAFCQFVLGDANASLEATSIHETRFLNVAPDLSADLRRVHTSIEPLQRVLNLKLKDQRPVKLMLWLLPSTGDAGEIQLTVHALEE